jgi:hypothetical protein
VPHGLDKNRENNPMQSRVSRLAALAQRATMADPPDLKSGDCANAGSATRKKGRLNEQAAQV